MNFLIAGFEDRRMNPVPLKDVLVERHFHLTTGLCMLWEDLLRPCNVYLHRVLLISVHFVIQNVLWKLGRLSTPCRRTRDLLLVLEVDGRLRCI
jgi:hypothetical protein